MDERMKPIIAQRLASASGHLCGVERMAREDASCIEVIRQLQAVQAALNKLSVLMLEAHLDACILAAVQGEDIAERERVLGELASIFEMSEKQNYLIKGDFHDNGEQNIYRTQH
jgi:CsoR family transcriptional regulator, copper-sensing transcriptional repressor